MGHNNIIYTKIYVCFDPLDRGFYDDKQDWIKLCGSGELILYTKLTSWNTWSISHVDKEDNQVFLAETDDTEIILQNINYNEFRLVNYLLIILMKNIEKKQKNFFRKMKFGHF